MNIEPQKWYLKPYVFIIAFLCVGPFALPLLWINPRLSRNKKIIITLIIVVLSYFIGLLLAKSMGNISSYYQQIEKLSQYR